MPRDNKEWPSEPMFDLHWALRPKYGNGVGVIKIIKKFLRWFFVDAGDNNPPTWTFEHFYTWKQIERRIL